MSDSKDPLDQASERSELAREVAARNTGRDIPQGPPGDCEVCGEWFGRLIGGACVPCRKQYKLP